MPPHLLGKAGLPRVPNPEPNRSEPRRTQALPMSGCLVGHGLSRDDPKGRCKRRTLVRCYQPDPLEVSGLSSPNLPGNPAWARQAPLSARGPAPTAPAARRRPPSPAASTPPPAAAATAGRRACLRGGGTLGLQRRSEVRQAGVGAPPHRHVLAHRQTLAGLLLAARQRQVGVEPAERLVADGFAVWKARDRPSALRRLSRVGHRKAARPGTQPDAGRAQGRRLCHTAPCFHESRA